MIKLKGGAEDDKNSILAHAAKRMNLPMANAAKSSGTAGKANGPGSSGAINNNNSNNTTGPSELAKTLGMPSAMKSLNSNNKLKKDWSNHSNRINLNASVYIQGKSEAARLEEEEEQQQLQGDELNNKQSNVTYLGKHFNSNSDDDELDELENELGLNSANDDPAVAEQNKQLEAIRSARLAEIKRTAAKKSEFLSLGHGSYNEISQDDFLSSVTSSKYVLCHFFHSAFERCKIVDKHLQSLAGKHLATKFIKINAEKAPFFVQKLVIKTLPTIVLFKDGIAIDRVIGFEELGGNDEFTTKQLEARLEKTGVLYSKDKLTQEEKQLQAHKARKAKNSIRVGKKSNNVLDNEEDSEDD
jgi:thiol-disulfide isomerase/thioredoxin